MGVKYFLGGLDSLPVQAQGGREQFDGLLGELGFDRTQELGSAEMYIAINADSAELRNARALGIPYKFLIRMESESVWPANFRPAITRQFDEVLNVGFAGQTLEGWFTNWPQYYPSDLRSEQWPRMEDRSDEILMIASDKFSAHRNTNYPLRRLLATEAPGITTAGRDWDRKFHSRLKVVLAELLRHKRFRLAGLFSYLSGGRPRRFLGPLENKLEVSREHKYCLIIENDSTYATEKLFDAYFAGCYPIYVGPQLDGLGIPSELVIQASSSLRDLRNMQEELSSRDLSGFHHSLREWLFNDEVIKTWSAASVWRGMAQRVASSYRKF